MASTCSSCAESLSFFQRLGGRSLCSSCAQKDKQRRAAARDEYEATLARLVKAPAAISEIENRLPVLAQEARLADSQRHKLHLETFDAYVDTALADDCLTEEEERHIFQMAAVLGLDAELQLDGIMSRLLVAKVNDGRLPTVTEPNIMLKKGEVVHAEMTSELMKTVKIREYQGGYSGFSFRIAKGVRYHTGRTRGRSVVVGTELQVQDEGILSVTSQRAVYMGAGKTIELPYKKLLNLNVFSDGVQFHMSNRVNPPMFRLQKGDGDVVAAIVNEASQPFL